MPYDPRMLQMAQMGVGMMGPPQGDPFDRNAPRPKQWWEQMPAQRGGLGGVQSPQDDPSKPGASKQPQPSLLQMLMLGGKPTMSGSPAAPGSPQAKAWTDMQGLFKSAGPYGLLGGMGLPGGPGWGGGTPG